jgi:hypothetical protein
MKQGEELPTDPFDLDDSFEPEEARLRAAAQWREFRRRRHPPDWTVFELIGPARFVEQPEAAADCRPNLDEQTRDNDASAANEDQRD